MTDKKTGKMSVRFRNLNIFFFVLASFLMLAIMFIVLLNITNKVSKDYAKMYSAEMLGTLNAYFSGEIALLRKAAFSNAIINWFDDEENQEKKRDAYDEMMGTIRELWGKNLYIGIEKTLSEISVDYGDDIDDIQPFATLDPNYYDDAWYFECTSSDKDYLLNVDIDKLQNRTLVWLNYKVARDDKIYGVLCTGLEFSGLVGNLFDQYDNKSVRSLIIDENGVIQMDSTVDGYIVYQIEDEHFLENEFTDKAFLAAVDTYLENIDGYFTMDSPISIIGMKSGQFRYASIAPINSTPWSVITLYDSSALFGMIVFIPLIAAMLILLIIYISATNTVSNRYIIKPFENLYERTSAQNKLIVDSINYASRIQANLLPDENIFEAAFADHSIFWDPRNIVGGDIYWIKRFGDETILCVADCTGHGTPGAMLTMLVVSIFEALITEENYQDTALLLYQLDNRLATILNVRNQKNRGSQIHEIIDGCDLAILWIKKDGGVSFSAGNMNVYVCDGKEVTRYRGQRIFVGEGKLSNQNDVRTETIRARPEQKFYLASDGIFDQVGGHNFRPFGYQKMEQIILEHHHEMLINIAAEIWSAFRDHQGTHERVDDLQLITFQPKV